MARLRLCLLGPFHATLDGEPVTSFETDKVRALLAYLVVEAQRPHRRQELAGLLWPDWPERSARTNLRNALSNLRQAIGDRKAHPPFLLINRTSIQFNLASDHWLDVRAFEELLEADEGEESGIQRLEAALALYGAAFLEGFSLKDSAGFEDWSLLVREQLRRQRLSALGRLAQGYAGRGEHERACEVARQRVELDPLDEEAHRALMGLYATAGRGADAARQYRAAVRVLEAELGIPPSAETTALYERIRAGEDLGRELALAQAPAIVQSAAREDPLHGRYRLDAELGRGGRAVVYRAHDTLLEREVAVKVLSATKLGTKGRARMLREARAAASLNYPNIVTVYDAGEVESPDRDEPLPYIVMELVPGPSLHDQRPTDLDEILVIACQICAALEHAHAQGVIHRDLKPENVLLAPDGTAKLTDLGLARSVASRLTTEGALVGTVFYVAPEQALGRELDGRADLYALGVLLYELTTGQLPFTGDDPLAVISQHLYASVVPPSAHNPEIPSALDALVLQLLSKEPDDRPSSAAEVLETLEDIARPGAAPVHVLTPLPAFLDDKTEAVAVERPVFVAREPELARLGGFLEASLTGKGQVVFITGGPGRGKTSLMREFARRVMETYPELLVASGTCNAYFGPGDPHLPFRQALEMLTGDVEDRWAAGTITTQHARRLWAMLPHTAQVLSNVGVDLIETVLSGRPLVARAKAATVAKDTDWVNRLARTVELRADLPPRADLRQSDLYEQCVRVLQEVAHQAPLLVTLDDLQWADEASIAMLLYLGRRVAESRILLLCAYRPEEVALGRDGERHPLQRVLNELRRVHGDVVVDLADADRVAGRGFVDALIDGEPNRLGDGFRQALLARTGGHPLFTVELLRTLQERADLTQDAEGHWVAGPALTWDTLPARVEAVIEERIGRLDKGLRETLSVASVEGEDFTAQVISRIQHIQEHRLLRQLSQELDKRHRLVREQGEARVGQQRLSRYRFAHHLFQHYLYHDLSIGERRLLHGEVAQALEALYAEDREPMIVQLAYHFRQAEEPNKALHYLAQAGHQARTRYAYEDAIAYFQAAIEQLAQLPFPRRAATEEGQRRITQMHEGLGDVLALTGQHDQARSAFEEALSHVPDNDAIWQARLERKVGVTWDTQRILNRALKAYRLAETTLESESPAESAEYWHEWLEIQLSLINVHYLRGCLDEMVETLEKTQPLVEQHGTQDQRVRFLHNRNLAGTLRERFVPSEETVALSRTALAIRQESGNPSSIAHGQFNLAFNLLCRGALDQAEEQLQSVLEFGAHVGDAWLETVSLAYLTVVYRKRGQVAQTQHYAERTLEAARANQLDWYIAMANANLAWLAWRAGNASAAQEGARAALEAWQKLRAICPWEWTARWPLISVALAQDNVSGAIDHVHALLDPKQQRLPDTLTGELEAAIQEWDAGDTTAAHTYLKRAIELAQNLGYL